MAISHWECFIYKPPANIPAKSTLYTGHAHKLHRSDNRGHNKLCYLFLFSYCTVEPEKLSVYTSVMTIGTTPLDNDFCISCFDQELVKTIWNCNISRTGLFETDTVTFDILIIEKGHNDLRKCTYIQLKSGNVYHMWKHMSVTICYHHASHDDNKL